jgi:hypothetical protein
MRGIKVACGHFMKHRCKNDKVFSANERDFDVAPLGDRPIKITRYFDTSEAATQNDDSYHSALIRNSSPWRFLFYLRIYGAWLSLLPHTELQLRMRLKSFSRRRRENVLDLNPHPLQK